MDSTTNVLEHNCNACGGTGYQQNILTGIKETCPVCGGSGRIYNGPSVISVS